MPAAQQLLFPDPQPLVERLGREFFRQLPPRPGVYLMRDAGDVILYIGKAKNLRQRLGSYRVANPDRLPRRHLRLLRAVVRIELQECPTEALALAREAQLLREVRPKYNRAGTWPGLTRFLVWRAAETTLHLAVTETPDPSWNACGPLGSPAHFLRAALARLLHLALPLRPGLATLPVGWLHGQLPPEVTLPCGPDLSAVLAQLELLARGDTTAFCLWLQAQLPCPLHPVEKAMVDTDLETITEALRPLAKRQRTQL